MTCIFVLLHRSPLDLLRERGWSSRSQRPKPAGCRGGDGSVGPSAVAAVVFGDKQSVRLSARLARRTGQRPDDGGQRHLRTVRVLAGRVRPDYRGAGAGFVAGQSYD